jgi:hypothetical protein
LDSKTLEQLRRLETLKREAVKNEDYQMAKNLKDRIQRLKNLGEQIALLESRKEKAIAKEDYDSAMVLKEEIQRLRGQFQIGGEVEGYGRGPMSRDRDMGGMGNMPRRGDMDPMNRERQMMGELERPLSNNRPMMRNMEERRNRGFSDRMEDRFNVQNPNLNENFDSMNMNNPSGDIHSNKREPESIR